MARRYWTGLQQVVRQVSPFTITAVGATNDTISFIVNNKKVTYATAGGDTTTTFATAIAALFATSEYPEIREITATSNGAVVTLTGPTDGTPFTVTTAVTGAATISAGSVTNATSPHHANDALNYDGGTLPSGTDEVCLLPGTPDVKFGLTYFNATAIVLNRYAGGPAIGLPNTNATGGYAEYRQKRMQLASVTARIETTTADRPGSIRLELTGAAAAVTIVGESDPGVGGEPVELWDLTNNSSVTVTDSGVRILDEDSVAATDINVTALRSSVITSSRATLSTVKLNECNAIIRGKIDDSYSQDSGSNVDFLGSVDVNIAQFVIDDGTLNWITTADIIQARVGSGGDLNLSRGAGTVNATTAIKIHEGGKLTDPDGRLEFDAAIFLIRHGLSGNINIGTHRGIILASINSL